MKRKIRMPDIMESIFDIGYLLFAIGTGVVCLGSGIRTGNSLALMVGILALVLGIGDAFHLVPRVMRALFGEKENTEKALGLGLAVSSVTMTVFYIIVYYIWKMLFLEFVSTGTMILGVILWGTALFRIVVCFLPQNNWFHKEGNMKFSLLRNIPFAVTGLVVVVLFFLIGNSGGLGLCKVGIAVIISFVCYFPVTLFAKKKPMIGMLMIPKTCAYVWILVMLSKAAGVGKEVFQLFWE